MIRKGEGGDEEVKCDQTFENAVFPFKWKLWAVPNGRCSLKCMMEVELDPAHAIKCTDIPVSD